MGWIINDVVTADYDASVGELVRVNMLGKAAHDVVCVSLPAPDSSNKGQSVKVVTVNCGGCEDGSVLRIETHGGKITPPGDYYSQDLGGGEQFYEFISDGTNWVSALAGS